MEFYETLGQLRRRQGLSQEQLADLMGVSRQAVGKWEAGQSMPDLPKLIALADQFGVSLDDLVRPGQTTQQAGTPQRAAADRPESDPAGEPAQPGKSRWIFGGCYEYKSKRRLLGVPLVHIHMGYGGRVCVAKGIFALGNVAVGGVAIGGVSAGLFALGGVSLGLLALGGVAVGAVAAGGFAAGGLVVGGLAVGGYAFGGCAVGSRLAAGGAAFGSFAIGANPGVDLLADGTVSRAAALSALDAALPRLPGFLRALVGLFFA